MRKAILGLSALLIGAVVFMSCDDDEVISEADLPALSKTFLSTHFSGVNVNRIEKERDNYSVHLANRIEVDFNKEGEWIEVDGEDGVVIPTGFILPKIVAYVDDQYKDNDFNGIEKKLHGFDVDLVRGDIDLVFDKDGNFLRIDP
ncbi:PepSY-like domain-containing protein [Sphingobacterium psychroaquaticum]|uniref:Putative beta-lactamase-inhibitor-like, PepSY-like n=1 Tax=Sphingobacterium psychroaquaticum TaxID=561061 RepID=A0A1X7KRX6_9SPHI|nr:PepSY-like domain-containing protein [Sphingobacterium psychroaquaticum]SMG43975.1 Putative beta-lactamase-inhibitor-like, PepSY-like [Sphingobacterium psychroaquaticum]